uniref:Ycf2 N-terminal domain-containing protein n=1 Tax=Utricularia reniformis TaxID=192314 RepID=A0A1Y0B040_9LAMI|nr:hypothetical protein AEK19_MT0551 [Utricularia reniformis]ART30806.1 hypothetical protein AEK19_MT0551 [Utricularia reniformis]
MVRQWVNKDRFFRKRKVRNVSSNMKIPQGQGVQVTDSNSSQRKGSSDQSRDHLDSISNFDSESHINQREIQPLKERSFFCPCPRSENKELVTILKIIKYFKNTVSMNPISSDPGCDRVLKDEPDMDSSHKISVLNKNPF